MGVTHAVVYVEMVLHGCVIPLSQLSTNFPLLLSHPASLTPFLTPFSSPSPLGLVTVLVPLYISEVSPVGLRGTMGVMHQMAITSTILLSNVFGLHQVYAAAGYPCSQALPSLDEI